MTITPSELTLLREISQYEGADRIADGTPEALLADSLEEKGLIKMVALNGGETVWRVSGFGLDHC